MCANEFIPVSMGAQYPNINTGECSNVGRKAPPVTPLACLQHACKSFTSANVVGTMPSEGWCNFRHCSNTHSIPYAADGGGNSWTIYAKHP